MKYSTYGRHVICDAWEIDDALINDKDFLLNAMSEALLVSGATIQSVQVKSFCPQGLTIAFLLSESHLSIHTYPEEGFAAIDCYTCGNTVNPELMVKHLLGALKPKRVYTLKLVRGTGDFEIKDRF
jgi:S-adenosylmethionine decarboxylase